MNAPRMNRRRNASRRLACWPAGCWLLVAACALSVRRAAADEGGVNFWLVGHSAASRRTENVPLRLGIAYRTPIVTQASYSDKLAERERRSEHQAHRRHQSVFAEV